SFAGSWYGRADLRAPNLVAIKVEAVKQAGAAAYIDRMVYDQWCRVQPSITGEAPLDLSAKDVDRAQSSVVQVKSEIAYKCRSRIRVEPSEACAGTGVEDQSIRRQVEH